MSAVLCASGVSVSFGGVHAVVDVDLEVGEGRLVGLIGPNGAGKTTFIDAITGFVRSSGRVELDGTDLTGLPAAPARAARARAHVAVDRAVRRPHRAREPPRRRAPPVRVGAHPGDGHAAGPRRRARSPPRSSCSGSSRSRTSCRTSSRRAQRKLVGIARALVAKPRLVCLDEPAAGLDTNESEELGRRLRRLVDGGQSMLLVDHDMGLVLGICDEIVVLEFGEVIARGEPDVVRRNPRVIAAYLGSAAGRGSTEAEHG